MAKKIIDTEALAKYHSNCNEILEAYTKFDTTQAYAVGDFCVKDGILYKFTSAHAAGAWNASNVVATTVMNEIKNGIKNLKDGSSTGSVRSVNAAAESDEYHIGPDAFAEGFNTKANGNSSHSEGDNTMASGEGSHAEGCRTKAIGNYSHASGFRTEAKNEGEFAIGNSNVSIEKDANNAGTLFTVGNGEQNSEVSYRQNAFRIDKDGAVYAPQLKVGSGTLQNVSLDSNGQLVLGGGGAGSSMTEVTASELRTLVSNSGLTAGSLYRVTDYQCTRSDYSNSQNATHQFDIVLLALSNNTLEKKGWAIQHSGDTYFANSDLSQWQVWFDIALDTYGRVLRLIDENRNDCQYDFKNVMWLYDGNYYYTFSLHEYDAEISDYSLYLTCHDNSFGYDSKNNICIEPYSEATCMFIKLGYSCDNNIIISSWDITIGNECSSNIIGEGSYRIRLGNFCSGNFFEYGCYFIDYGDNCSDIKLGYFSDSIICEGNCSNIIFGESKESLYGIRYVKIEPFNYKLIIPTCPENTIISSNCNRDSWQTKTINIPDDSHDLTIVRPTDTNIINV